jgi:hypothetical protein
MDIVCSCNQCGNRISAPAAFAGLEIPCPICHFAIPLPDCVLDAEDLLSANVALYTSPSTAQSATDDRVLVRCDQCFQQYLVPAATIDHQFDCPKCQHTFSVPATALQNAHNLDQGIDEQRTNPFGSETLDELEATAYEGSPLHAPHRPYAWLPNGLRQAVTSIMHFVEHHPLALVAMVVGLIAWMFILAFVLH